MNENEDVLISLDNLAEYHELSNAELEASYDALTDLINEKFAGLDIILDDIIDGAIDADDREY